MAKTVKINFDNLLKKEKGTQNLKKKKNEEKRRKTKK